MTNSLSPTAEREAFYMALDKLAGLATPPTGVEAILREVTDALRELIDFKSDIKVADLIRRAETLLAGHQGEGA